MPMLENHDRKNSSTDSQKCASKGCDRRRIDGSDFCLFCLTARKGNPASRTTCDNLLAIRDPSGI